MKVLVRFKGDNDFGPVMRAFGELLLRRVQAKDALTPEKIAAWFNEISYVLYEMVQCADGRGPAPTAESVAKMRAYLQIEPRHVFIDEAVDEKLKSAHCWANYDAVFVDGSEHARMPVYFI